MAAAIGRSIEIPIIVRSLGHDLYRFGLQENTRFRPGVELLIYIDGNLSSYGLDDPNLQVEDFYLPWWNGARPRIKHNTYLSFSTLATALAEHKVHLSNLTGSAQAPIDFTAELNKPAYTWHSEAQADLENPCTRCRLYRAVSLGIVDKLRDVQNRVHGLEVANQGEHDIGMRRASGFNALYEMVLQKEIDLETAAESGSGPGLGRTITQRFLGSKKGKGKAKEVTELVEKRRVEAEEQWYESSRHPGSFQDSASKWTWGVELNSQDLWDMIRGADKQYQLPHSGYDEELATGKLRSASPVPTPNEMADITDPNNRFDELAHDFPFIRDLRPNEIPIAFSFPTLHYKMACETESGPEAKSAAKSGSEYNGDADGIDAKRRQKRQAMQDEANSYDRPSTSDSVSVILKRSHPHRPWLGPPPSGYVRSPTSNVWPTRSNISISAMTVENPTVHTGQHSEVISDPESDQMDTSDNGSDYNRRMNLVAPDDSDEELPLTNLGLDPVDFPMTSDIRLGHFGLVVPDSPDDSDEEIPRSYGLVAPDSQDDSDGERSDGDYGLVAPDLQDDSDEDISVSTYGLVVPDSADDSDERETTRNLDMDTADSDMRFNPDYEGYGSDVDDAQARVRVRIPLPRVNPATGQYTADSFTHVPDEWLD